METDTKKKRAILLYFFYFCSKAAIMALEYHQFDQLFRLLKL